MTRDLDTSSARVDQIVTALVARSVGNLGAFLILQILVLTKEIGVIIDGGIQVLIYLSSIFFVITFIRTKLVKEVFRQRSIQRRSSTDQRVSDVPFRCKHKRE